MRPKRCCDFIRILVEIRFVVHVDITYMMRGMKMDGRVRFNRKLARGSKMA